MPIEESEINEKIAKLREKLNDLNARRKNIRDTIDSLESIRMVKTTVSEKDEKDNPITRVIEEAPIDHATRQKMTASRRQEIFNASKKAADDILTPQ